MYTFRTRRLIFRKTVVTTGTCYNCLPEDKSTCSKRVHVEDIVKVVPLQAWSGPEGSRKIRFPEFMTTAQDGGKVVSLTHRPPLPQEIHLVLISVRG
jgi:hypothetical protein